MHVQFLFLIDLIKVSHDYEFGRANISHSIKTKFGTISNLSRNVYLLVFISMTAFFVGIMSCFTKCIQCEFMPSRFRLQHFWLLSAYILWLLLVISQDLSKDFLLWLTGTHATAHHITGKVNTHTHINIPHIYLKNSTMGEGECEYVCWKEFNFKCKHKCWYKQTLCL